LGRKKGETELYMRRH